MIELDPKNYRTGHDAFLRHMQERGDNVPFEGFGHRFFVTDETAYKEETLARARKILQPAKWPEWQTAKPGRIVEKLKEACQPPVAGNLLEHKFGAEKGSYGAIYKLPPELVSQFETQCVRLYGCANGPDEVVGKAVDSFADFLREKHLGCKWEFLAYLLFILRPERFFPIRSTHFERVLKFYGVEKKISGRVEWERYKTILDVADALKEKLAEYGTATAIQVQSYMWVISYLLPLDDVTPPTKIVDYAEELRRRQERDKERHRIGLKGETYVYEYERRRLTEEGRPDLAERVSLVSAIDESVGYDVASFQSNAEELHIEVKSTLRSQENDIGFWISDNELRTAQTDPAWLLFRVWQVDSNPNHANFGNVAKELPDGWVQEASTWKLRPNPDSCEA